MKKICIYLGMAVGIFLSSATVQAGEINGNEASVISAAGGTFEYKGETYVAKQSYLDQLSAKLSQDDVDLTAQEASQAIAEIYNNVATGVKEGYLEKVTGGESSTVTGDESSPGKGDAGNAQSQGDDTPAAGEKPSENPETGGNSETVPSTEGQNTTGDGDEGKEVVKPSKGKFDFEMDDVSSYITITEQSSANEVYEKLQEVYVQPLAKAFLLFLGLGVVIAMVVIVIRKKGKWKKIWPAALGTLFLIAGISIGAVSALTAYGFCSGKVLVNRVAADGYYKKVYNSFHEDTASLLEKAGFPRDILDEIFTERSVYLDGKLALEATFNSGRTKEFMNVQENIKETLLNYLIEENYSNVSQVSGDVATFASLIQSNYTDRLKFGYADWLSTAKEIGQKRCMICAGIGIALCLLGLLILILGQRYIHRIFRIIGWSSFVSSVAMLLTAGAYIFMKKYEDLGLLQENYSQFFSGYLRWNGELLVAAAGLEMVLFLCCFAMTATLKKSHRRNKFQKIR